MGLLSHVTSSYLVQQKSAYPLIDFSKKSNVKGCALYSCINGKMVMSDCMGFDAVTVSKSVSSVDFWKGTIGQSSRWLSFDKNNMSHFYQFFSVNDLKKIEILHFLRISEDVVLMAAQLDEVINLPLEQDVIKQMPSKYVDKLPVISDADKIFSISNSKVSLLSVSLRQALDKILKNVIDFNFRRILENTICRAVYYQILQSCAEPNKAFYVGNGVIKLVIFSISGIDESLFQFHMTNSVEDILGDSAKSVLIVKSATATTVSEIKAFL